MAVGLWAPFAGPWLAARGLDATRIGVALGTGAAMKLIAPWLWGWLADASGRHARLIAATSAATAVAAAALVWAPVTQLALWIGVLMFFWNAGNPQLEVVTLRHLGAAGHRYGRIRLWGSLGFLATVLAAGAWFARAGFGAFPVLLLAALAASAVVAAFVPDAPRAQPVAGPASLRAALVAPGVVPLFGALLLMQAGFGAYYGFFSLYVGTLGWSPGAVGAFWALGVVAEIVAFAVLPAWSSRVRPGRLLAAACVVTALRWLATAVLADRIAWLVAAQLMHAASFAVYHAVAVRMVLDAFPGRLAGRGQALHATIAYGVGGASGTMASGWLWDAVGPASPFLFATGAAVGAWAAVGWAMRRAARDG